MCSSFVCLSWTAQETSTERYFLYIKTSWMHPHLPTWSLMFYKTKKLSVGTIPERTIFNSLEINPNMDIISTNWYQWYASTHVCYYRYIKHWLKKMVKMWHFCILQNTWKIHVLHLPGASLLSTQKSSLTLLGSYRSQSPILKCSCFEASSRQFNMRQASPLFLPDCHNAHWLRPLHLLPWRHGLQSTRSWGRQLTAVELTILKERSGFRLHTARRV